jgi:hypothetical protein
VITSDAVHPAAMPEPRYYVPGRAGWKLLLCGCGLVLFAVGCLQLWSPLRLLLAGGRAQGVATRIVETKPGSADVIVAGAGARGDNTGSADDGALFWNEFAIEPAAGSTVIVRDNVGSRLKPLYPLIDDDGLPTTRLVCYDRRHWTHAIFPGEISTWLIPVGLAFAGLAAFLINAVLFYWAGKPIELPDIQPAAPPQSI